MLYYVAVTLYVLVCLLLLLVVLLQQGRGGDMASAFGGGGGTTQTAFGARSGATLLTRATTVLGALFMLGSIALGIYGQRGPGSLMSGTKAPAPVQQPAPPKTPAPQEQPPAKAPTPQPPAPDKK